MKQGMYFLGWAEVEHLRHAAKSQGSSNYVLAAVDRLENFQATEEDLTRLRQLANSVGVNLPNPNK